jgi:hypothetical protein
MYFVLLYKCFGGDLERLAAEYKLPFGLRFIKKLCIPEFIFLTLMDSNFKDFKFNYSTNLFAYTSYSIEYRRHNQRAYLLSQLIGNRNLLLASLTLTYASHASIPSKIARRIGGYARIVKRAHGAIPH